MNRLERHIDNVRKTKQKLFCAYVTLGFPHLAFTQKLISALEKSGVDIIELGMPFSDPLADGPTIQEASHRSLANNTKVHDAFSMIHTLRRSGLRVPVIFFSYYNIIFHYGITSFVRELARCGFDGVLCPDLPPEEDRLLERELKRKGLSLVYLIAPTSSESRMKLLAGKSSGFIYYVSRRGVTGIQRNVAQDLKRKVRQIKNYTTKSVLVGFGVSDAKQIKKILSVSDGVIVGSAIINQIKKTASVKKTAHFVARLVKAVKRAR